jgi:hypothetical protein
MTKMNHLHTSLTEPLSAYRRCDVPTLLGQIPETVKQLISSGSYKRVASVDDEGEYTPVGVLFPLTPTIAIRVLYTYFDLYEVQFIKISGDAMDILESSDGIFAEQLGEVIMNKATRWSIGEFD